MSKLKAPKPKFDTNDDDWETDPTYENVVTEKSQRYGSTSVAGSGRVDHVNFKSIQDKIKSADGSVTQMYQEKNPNRGYGGKFGTEQVMDKTAADFSYKADIKRHSSQTDGKKGFGGEHGIDERAKDKSAVGYDYKANVEKHSSQTDFSKGFGGKFGTDQNVQDKSAVGFSHKEVLPKHSSQKDYTSGFGGKFGVQKEEPRQVSPVISTPPATEIKSVEKPTVSASNKADVGNLRARFENMKKTQETEAANRVAEERKKRSAFDQKLQEKEQPNKTNLEKSKKEDEVSTTKNVTEDEKSTPARPKTPPPEERQKTPPPEERQKTPPPPPEERQETPPPPPAERPKTPTSPEESSKTPPPPDHRPKTPTSPEERSKTPTLPEEQQANLDENKTETSTTENSDKYDKFVGNINVTSLLRQQKNLSSASHNDEDDDDDDDEWTVDKK